MAATPAAARRERFMPQRSPRPTFRTRGPGRQRASVVRHRDASTRTPLPSARTPLRRPSWPPRGAASRVRRCSSRPCASTGLAVYAPTTASADLTRRVGKVVGHPPLSELGADQRREFHDALLDADSFEDL